VHNRHTKTKTRAFIPSNSGVVEMILTLLAAILLAVTFILLIAVMANDAKAADGPATGYRGQITLCSPDGCQDYIDQRPPAVTIDECMARIEAARKEVKEKAPPGIIFSDGECLPVELPASLKAL
jgi:hypothetical protein